jgi:hypothetical protein
MRARQSSFTRARFNHLRRGTTYLATTDDAVVVGEYLGMEVPFGGWALLLRHETGTESIPLHDIVTIFPAAA